MKSSLLVCSLLFLHHQAGAAPSAPDAAAVEPVQTAESVPISPIDEPAADPTEEPFSEESPAPAGTPGSGEKDDGADMLPAEIIPWHESMLALPEWLSAEQEEITSGLRPANQGGGLFPPQIWAMQPGAGPLGKAYDQGEAEMEEEGTPGEPAAVALSPEQMALYTGQKPTVVLLDPQRLIKGRPAGWMESLVQRWLNEQSAFPTTLLVFGPGQLLPADFDPQALRRQWFGEDDASLLVLYFYRQPERTLAIFGPKSRATYSEDLLRSTVEAAVTETGRVPGAGEQLERFCYKMSVRLHWLSRLRIYPTPAGGPVLPGSRVLNHSRKASWLIFGGAVLMAGGGLAHSWLRRRHAGRAGRGETILLPEAEHRPRFGAPHSGGFSSVVNFVGTPPVS